MVRVIALVSFTAILSLSCDGSELFTGPLTSESCSSGGRTYSGSVPSGTWRRADSPHVLLDSVVVDSTLRIEPGTLVCGMPGSTLVVPELEAIGTADSPIVFTSGDPDGWGGLGGDGVIRNARIEGPLGPCAAHSRSSARSSSGRARGRSCRSTAAGTGARSSYATS